MARLLTTWHLIRAGLWFAPTVMTVLAVALAWAMLSIDFGIAAETDVWWLHSGSARDASDLLETLLSSLITMTTLAVSLTMVVLTLAAGQLGPRLIPSFIDDRRTQLPIGLFVATIVYLLLVLRTLNEAVEAVPHAAVTVGTALVLLCIGTLLFFIHHLSRSIVSDRIIEQVGLELDQAILAMLPEHDAGERTTAAPSPSASSRSECTSDAGGYIQAIECDRLVRTACEHDVLIELLYRAGHHVLPTARIARITPARDGDGIAAEIRKAVVLGRERTPVQDLEYSIRQLVEIALRALSSGINDEFTAIAAIDRLAISYANVMRRGSARHVWTDEDGRIRLTIPPLTFQDLLAAGLHQIRQSAEGNPAVIIRLREAVLRLLEVATSDAQREALKHHDALILAAGRRGIKDPSDLLDLDGRNRTSTS